MNLDVLSEIAGSYPAAVVDVLVDLAPWLLLGLVLAGVIEWVLPASKVLSWLGAGRRFAVLRAALLGVPLPLCSCGVVPVALALRRRGAGRAATVSFLVTTPQSGADSIAATWGLMGAPFAIARSVLTFVTGLAAGWAVQWVDPEPQSASLKIDAEEKTEGLLRRVFSPGWSILVSIHGSLILGILLAAAVSVAVPDGAVTGALAGMAGLLVMVALALPLYVCATASIPLAMQFVDKGFSPGAAFVFLLVGPATNFATALIVRREIGGRAMAAYLSAITFFGLGAGLAIDALKIPLAGAMTSHRHASGGTLEALSASLLAGGLVFLWLNHLFSQREDLMSEHVLTVEGMTCDHCRRTVEKAVGSVPGADNISVDLSSGQVGFDGADPEPVKRAIRDAGFDTP